ncbi:MAG: YXWGXW repeat-containing protein [Pirellulales bacterium]|nr:YXWGXW repeat-containing protein [Pirellulales bacterium]
MNVLNTGKWYVAGTLLVLGLSFGLNSPLFAQQAPADAEEGVQVLTRGPVHEAFAETVTFDPEPGVVVPKAPPAAIEELPPEQRLDGTNVAWIPGYWAWDDERNDFLWVSGIWRDLPPGRQWVPGYWGQSEQGFQWTSGYWADAQMNEVEYLPEPPASVEVGPNIAATSADQTWLPGCWVWRQNRYAWRPGFWANAHPDWVWTPAHYVWAPRGYIYVDGYWDYSVGRRGVLFAPVYFSPGVYGRRGFSYSPTTVIDLGVFTSHLFWRPRYQHYYFGDYYAASYRSAGYHPWYSINTGRFGYDPIYAHNRWRHRQDRGWEQRQQAYFQQRRDREDFRPPRTWTDQRKMDLRSTQARERGFGVAESYDDFRRTKNSSLRFQPVNQSERQQYRRHAQDVRRFSEERQKLEYNAASGPARGVAPSRARLPKSPIKAKPVAELGGKRAPPRTYEAPEPDTNVAPKPRADRSRKGPKQHSVNRIPPDQPQPRHQPKAEQQAPKRQPKAEQQAPKRQPKAEQQAPKRQPKAEQQAPKRQPKAEQQAPKRQPKAEQQAPKPRGKDSAESKPDKEKGKGKK